MQQGRFRDTRKNDNQAMPVGKVAGRSRRGKPGKGQVKQYLTAARFYGNF
jgi:hypothetical protein